MIALRHRIHEFSSNAQGAIRWLALLVPLSMVVGSACAFFLWSLDAVTKFRGEHPWMLY